VLSAGQSSINQKPMGQEHCSTGKKKYQQIKEKERYQIEGRLQAGLRPAAIALLLGRDRRNIKREIAKGTAPTSAAPTKTPTSSFAASSPKGVDIDKLTCKAIARIQLWINNYPRRLFSFLSSNNSRQSHCDAFPRQLILQFTKLEEEGENA